MFLTEYDEATTMRRLREEAIREGFGEGFGEGFDEGFGEGFGKGRGSILQRVREKVSNGSMSVQDACDLGFSEQEILRCDEHLADSCRAE